MNRASIIEEYDNLYNKLRSMSEVNEDLIWTKVAKKYGIQHFKLLTGLDVGNDESYVGKFIRAVEAAVMYPLIFGNVLLGYGFRGIREKNYMVLTETPMYVYSSWRAASAIKDKAVFRYGIPFVLSEGPMDAEFLSMIWPFSYAYMMASVSDALAQMLSMFSNRVVLVPDNDAGGREGEKRTIEVFGKYGVDVKAMRVPGDFEDPGKILEGIVNEVPRASQALSQVKIQLNLAIHLLGGPHG